MAKFSRRLRKIYNVFTGADTETNQILALSMAEFERMRRGKPLAGE